MTRPRIAYVGMTHLGLCSGIAAASKGFETLCFDPNADLVARLDAGQLPVVEPDLPELMVASRGRLRFSSNAQDLSACDVVYVAPDIPTDDRGQSDLQSIDSLLKAIEPHLKPAAVAVILSQVSPGFTRERLKPGLNLYYQVETLIFGRAVERATQPERIIVGCADPTAPIAAPYQAFLDSFGCPVLPMRLESAELAKISINMCLVASVSVANTLAELCERIGADWDEIAPALKLDRRIGAYSYLSAGLGIAGGNLERDLATVIRLSGKTGSDAGVVEAFVRNSRHRRDWALRTIHREILDENPRAVIGVLGLAYKENTHSTKNSPSVALLEHLHPWKVRVYDPVVTPTAVPHLKVQATSAALEAAQGADALIIMTPWPAFRQLDPNDLAKAMRGRLVIDPYRVWRPAAVTAAGLDYITLGVPPYRARSHRDA